VNKSQNQNDAEAKASTANNAYKAPSMRGWNRCAYCGKFISFKEFNNDKIKTDYTPDTAFTCEEIVHYHKECAV